MDLRLATLVLAYGFANLLSAVMIVVANKMVLSTYKFSFPVCLTWIHTIITAIGMNLMAAMGVYTVKTLPWRQIAPNAVAFACFVVFNNVSIKVNTVSFYQMSKICVTPTVVLIELLAYGKRIGRQQLLAVVVLMLGIALATVSDKQVSSNPMGVLIAVAAVLSTALCQVWAGSKQKELEASGNQLLQQLIPTAVVLLGITVPFLEPIGSTNVPDTILGYRYTPTALLWIAVSSCLGLVVTLSSYLFISVTSPLTFNIVGHVKTIAIMACGMLLFNDVLSTRKLLGILFAIAGIVWYSIDSIKVASPALSAATTIARSNKNLKVDDCTNDVTVMDKLVTKHNQSDTIRASDAC